MTEKSIPVPEEPHVPQPPEQQVDADKLYRTTITTDRGTIVMDLDPQLAPQSVNNFVGLARQGYYDGLTFHRVVPEFVIQGGCPEGTGRGGPGYKFGDEPVQGEYTLGAVAMANAGPNTNGSQFFVCIDDCTRKLSKDYNLFGYVVDGIDVASVDAGRRRDGVRGRRGTRPLTAAGSRTLAGVDHGLFGPDSVAWRLHADPVMLAGGLRALLVQALEPRAMAGVDQHSGYREDPWGRLRRTTQFVGLTTYGDTPTAEAACAKVRAVHEHIRGVDPVTGRAYAANDPDLLLWIHAVEVDSFVDAYRAYAGRLSDADADRYVVEMARVAELVELPRGMAPQSLGELREYLRGVPDLQVTPAAREGMRTIFFPPMPLQLRPLWGLVTAATVAIMPKDARRMYRLPWPPPATLPLRALRVRPEPGDEPAAAPAAARPSGPGPRRGGGRGLSGVRAGFRFGLHREPRRGPGAEAAVEVGGVTESEVLERRGRQARLVALVADDDDREVVVTGLGRPVGARRVEAPLEDVAVDHERAGDATLAPALLDRTDVDEERAGALCGERVRRGHAIESRACHREQLVDGRHGVHRATVSSPA